MEISIARYMILMVFLCSPNIKRLCLYKILFLNPKNNWFVIISNGGIQLNWNLHWIIYTNNDWIRGWFVYRLAAVVFDVADGVSWNASRHWEDPATRSLSLPHDDCHYEPAPRWRPCMHRRSSLPWQDGNKTKYLTWHTAQLYFCCHQKISCLKKFVDKCR